MQTPRLGGDELACQTSALTLDKHVAGALASLESMDATCYPHKQQQGPAGCIKVTRVCGF